MPWNAGTCTEGMGVSIKVTFCWSISHAEGPTWPVQQLYPRLHPEWCEPYASALRDYCDDGDILCCVRYHSEPNFAHFLYIFKYNMDVMRFIRRRLNETGPL